MDTRVIFGLGNPGREYENTRHNLGFMVLACLARQRGLVFKNCAFAKGWLAQELTGSRLTVLFLPATFMNLSGNAVRKVLDKQGVGLAQILLVCDDLNLDFGQMRLRKKGSDGGHNGLKSVIAAFASQEFARLRIGIGHPGNKDAVVDYVLQPFNKEERERLPAIVETAAECCSKWASQVERPESVVHVDAIKSRDTERRGELK
ncbi:MAG: aminoacyl-tRNA hydrolase [Candidatus Omnitrophica bacterium]|nr:aminoacyl-tRNA hydrolase [Candidatus Omnitrophota bacterium]